MGLKEKFEQAIGLISGSTAKKLNSEFIVTADENDGVAHLHFRAAEMQNLTEDEKAFDKRKEDAKNRFAHGVVPDKIFKAMRYADAAAKRVQQMGLSDVVFKHDDSVRRGDEVLHMMYLELPIDDSHAQNRRVIRSMAKMDPQEAVYYAAQKTR